MEDTLDRATDVFWEKGYEGASIADLTAAMGINSPSLYACFGSKEGLFRAVIERYDERRNDFIRGVIDAPTAREAARLFLTGVADAATDPNQHPPGCLLIQSGLSSSDAVIPKILSEHRAEKELALRERFECAKRAGDLPKTADPAALARYLVTVANGLCVQASAGASTKELHAVADIALASWPTNEKRKPASVRSSARRRPSRAARAA